jgi:hypothetical protein
MKNRLLTILVSTLAATTAAAADAPQPKALHCVDLSRIKQTEILDDQHMLFRMNDGKQYLNTLPHRCPGMRKDQPYLVRTIGDRLCDLDLVTMLDTAPFGFMPGASCGLSKFEPVTNEQIEMVKRAQGGSAKN